MANAAQLSVRGEDEVVLHSLRLDELRHLPGIFQTVCEDLAIKAFEKASSESGVKPNIPLRDLARMIP